MQDFAVNYWKFQKWLIYIFGALSVLSAVQMICYSTGSYYSTVTDATIVTDSVRDSFIVYSAGNFAQTGANITSGAGSNAAPFDLNRSILRDIVVFGDALAVLLFCLAWKYLVRAERTESDYVEVSTITVEKFALEFPQVPPDVTQGDLLEWLQGSIEVRVQKCHLVPNYNQLLQIVKSRSEVLSSIDSVNQKMAQMATSAGVKLHSSLRVVNGAEIEGEISRARNMWLDRLSAAVVARQETGKRGLMPPPEQMDQLLQPILAQLHTALGRRIEEEIQKRRSSKKMQFAQNVVAKIAQTAQVAVPKQTEVKPHPHAVQVVTRTRVASDVELESLASSADCSPKTASPPPAHVTIKTNQSSLSLHSPEHRNHKVFAPSDVATESVYVPRRASMQHTAELLKARTQQASVPVELRPQMLELWNSREDLLNKCADLQTQLMTEYVSGQLVAAFVIFRTQADRDEALRRIDEAASASCFRRRSTRAGFLGGPPLQAKPAPKPSTIIWENLGFDSYETAVRKIISRFLSGLLIAVTGMALYFALSFELDFPFFTYIATFIVIVVNTVLENTIRSLVQAEKHKNTDAIEDGISWQLFLRLFLNTALLIVAVNVSSDSALTQGITAESYSDLTPAWFRDVGQPLVVAMVYDIFLPFVPWLIEGAWAAARMQLLRANLMARPSQMELNSLLEGSDFAMAENYARITNVVFVCFMFSAGLPVLNLVAFGTFFVSFWADKVWFCYFVKTPPSYSLQVGRAASESLLYAAVLHTITAIWLFSGSTFQLDQSELPAGNQYVSWGLGVARFGQWQLIPHFALLALQLYWVLRHVLRLGPCYHCAQRCACLRVAEDGGMEDILAARGKRGDAKARELRHLKALHSKSYQDCLVQGLLDGDLPDYSVQRNAAYTAAFTLLEEDPTGRQADAQAIGLAEAGKPFVDVGYNNRIVKFNPSAKPRKSFQAKAGNVLRSAMRRVSAIVATTPKHQPKGRVVPMRQADGWELRSLSAKRGTLVSAEVVPSAVSESSDSDSSQS